MCLKEFGHDTLQKKMYSSLSEKEEYIFVQKYGYKDKENEDNKKRIFYDAGRHVLNVGSSIL